MKIVMIGIDHGRAPLKIREVLAFTKRETEILLKKLKEEEGVCGCVVLSTCNRLELWFSCAEALPETVLPILFSSKGVPKADYERYFVRRENEDAVKHLFLLAAGLKSQVIGEDQILSQIKEALTFARTLYCSDTVMEVLFRFAVTAGKQVKTKISIPKGNTSAAHKAIEALREQGVTFHGKRCLVIGNGEMGRLTALAMQEEGAEVIVTVRQYKSGMVNIPEGTQRINYGERYQLIPSCDFIFSATASPNVTITKEALNQIETGASHIFVDLALPRDIDPQIGQLKGMQLYDLDSFQIEQQSEEIRRKLAAAELLIQNKLEEFLVWYQCRELLPKLHHVSQQAAEDAVWRTQRAISLLPVDDRQQQELSAAMESSVQKVVQKLMFQIRDKIGPEVFRECLDAAAKVYLE